MELVGPMRVARSRPCYQSPAVIINPPQPILPPAVEQQYRSRSIADPGLKELSRLSPGKAFVLAAG